MSGHRLRRGNPYAYPTGARELLELQRVNQFGLQLRSRVVPEPPRDPEPKQLSLLHHPKDKKKLAPAPKHRIEWARLMARTLGIDPLRCPNCDHAMRKACPRESLMIGHIFLLTVNRSRTFGNLSFPRAKRKREPRRSHSLLLLGCRLRGNDVNVGDSVRSQGLLV